MGEITDSTNRAQGFSLMPVVWGFGATMGYVLTQALETLQLYLMSHY